MIVIWICVCIPREAQSQNNVNIIEAGVLQTSSINGQTVTKILDNVVLSIDRRTMYADSVYQFSALNRIQAYNIQIETENEIIWADTLFHNTLTDYSELRGRVIVESENNRLFSEAMDVSMPLDITYFLSPVRFEDDRGALLAESGVYYQQADSAIFRGNVQLSDSTQYLEADSLFMNRSTDLYELFGRVYAQDFEDNVTFKGNYLYADSTGYRLLTGGDAWLLDISESAADTTHLLAKKIELFETDSVSTMDAFGSVRIWSNKFSAIADTANYDNTAETFTLRSNPILWQKNIQLTGPLIRAEMEDDDIRFLSSSPRPIAVQEDSLTGRLHQMTGDTLHAFFENGAVERIRVFNNSEIIFHIKDENDEPDGLIELIANGSSTLYFREGEFDFFKAIENPDGSWLPEDPANIDRRLDNFSWDPGLKPVRPEIQLPRLPEIPDEPLFEFPPRYERYLEETSGEE
ncbi:MAG: OstA-like protein [Balneolaceae bacterium]|nr:OstA-like protein [Balneolaceae bacterium]